MARQGWIDFGQHQVQSSLYGFGLEILEVLEKGLPHLDQAPVLPVEC